MKILSKETIKSKVYPVAIVTTSRDSLTLFSGGSLAMMSSSERSDEAASAPHGEGKAYYKKKNKQQQQQQQLNVGSIIGNPGINNILASHTQ